MPLRQNPPERPTLPHDLNLANEFAQAHDTRGFITRKGLLLMALALDRGSGQTQRINQLLLRHLH